MLNDFEQTASDLRNSAAETYYRTANLFFVTDRYSEALELYNQAINIYPTWIKPHLLKGMALEKLDRWGEALEAYGAADRLQPNNPLIAAPALLNLANTRFVLGHYQETVLVCDRVINLVALHSEDRSSAAVRLCHSSGLLLPSQCRTLINSSYFARKRDASAITQSAARLAATAYQKMGDLEQEAKYLKIFISATNETSEEKASAQRRLDERELDEPKI